MTFTSEKIPRIWPFPVSWPEGAPMDRCILFSLDDETPLRLGPLSAQSIRQLCTDQPLVDVSAIKDDLIEWSVFLLESYRDDRWIQEFAFLSGAGLKRFPFGVRTSPIASLSSLGPGQGFQVETQNSVYRLLEGRSETDWACIWLNHVGFFGLPIDQLISETSGLSMR